jgi:hypothetical protein
MRKGEADCFFKIPRRLDDFPSFDSWDMGEFVQKTVSEKQGYQAHLFQEERDVYLWIQWTPAQMFHEKRKIYEKIYARCDASLRLYLESDIYRMGKRKTFFFQVPKSTIESEPYEPFVAAKFVSTVLNKRNFVSYPIECSPQEAGVFISWEHIGT